MDAVNNRAPRYYSFFHGYLDPSAAQKRVTAGRRIFGRVVSAMGTRDVNLFCVITLLGIDWGRIEKWRPKTAADVVRYYFGIIEHYSIVLVPALVCTQVASKHQKLCILHDAELSSFPSPSIAVWLKGSALVHIYWRYNALVSNLSRAHNVV